MIYMVFSLFCQPKYIFEYGHNHKSKLFSTNRKCRNESVNFIMCIFVCARLNNFDLWHTITIHTFIMLWSQFYIGYGQWFQFCNHWLINRQKLESLNGDMLVSWVSYWLRLSLKNEFIRVRHSSPYKSIL